MILRGAILLLLGPLAAAPQNAKPLAFDVASVKLAEPLPPPGPDGLLIVRQGGFPTLEPGRIHYPRETMLSLLTKAFEVEPYQVQGPKWIHQATYEIDATMPRQSTPPQVHRMLQTLLAERFHLAVHREDREFAGYSLALAKSGLKLKEGGAAPALVPGPPPVDKDGFPAALPQRPASASAAPRPDLPLGFFTPHGTRTFFTQRTTHYLAGYLSGVLHCPVSDRTGLTASYDFALTYLPEGMPAPPAEGTYPPAPDLFTALETQLGLRLEKARLHVDAIVVDRLERIPTAN